MLASVLILLGSIVVNHWVISTYRNQLISEAEIRALLLAQSTAISFTNILLYEELDLVTEGGLLDNYIRDLVADTLSRVQEMTVYDLDNRVIATNDYQRYFQRNSPEQTDTELAVGNDHLIRHIEHNSFEILIPLHISTRPFGTLVMQFSLQAERSKLSAFKNRMFLLTIGIAITGILIAFLVARTLAKPIKHLATEMRKVQEPRYTPKLDSKRRDEIGDLERGFVDMLGRLKSAADEKERQQQALIQAEKLASVGTLASGLAHEINNPLAGIRNCLRRIMARPQDLEQTQKYAQLMDSAWLRIEKVVRGLLDFAKKKELVLQRTDLNQIVKAACVLVDYRVKNQKIMLKLQLAQDLPAIDGDPQHLEQVFVNLLLNALDATPERGTIIVKTKFQHDKVIAELSDTGKGIPTDIQRKIFDPFFTTKPVSKGTGLGLSVTKAIVEEHQGSIDVLSSPDGTTFRLCFPRPATVSNYSRKASEATITDLGD
ncbi:HAMP domain-containing protein [candidate division KSB1 bacterium]|nr:HAMP domain-containing protein [candidate division KSB1 bacterium]NIR69336.1 HAMP domain-containing protein [candidate division KSB1 bacterium]NIT71069.1 HAMP domain-containing protein [candidate division KSB1 bacterium]NIX70749.1 HAMP domain-containing protein [candidate division KSB1 bacterium]